MTLLALRMFLGGALSKLWAFLKSLSFWQIVSLCLAIFALVQHFELVSARSSAARWHKQYDSEHSARAADRAAYRKAQDEAAAQNKAHVQQIEQQYKRNSDNEKDAYLRDLAELKRLRGKAPAPKGAANGAGSPQGGPAAPGTDGHGLQLSADEYLQAQEIELRLMHLQQYVLGLLAVDPNKP